MNLSLTYSDLKNDLALIEDEIEATIQTKQMTLNSASLQLLNAGGKRIRPAFALLGAHFGDYNIEKVKPTAVALELIHMASLVHDDVIDQSDLRRGKPTVKATWDNRTAMYTGDFMFASALKTISSLDSPIAHQLLSKTMVELTKGEIQQNKDKYRLNLQIKDYLRRIKRKTALLIASSCQLGAIASGAPSEIQRKLYAYGYYIGMSYQIIDDILDFTESSEQLGKPSGSDLINGQMTLPTLLAMKEKTFSHQLSTLFITKQELTQSDIDPIIKRIKNTKVIEQSFQISDNYLQKALTALDHLPNIKAKQLLKQIAFYIGKRKK